MTKVEHEQLAERPCGRILTLSEFRDAVGRDVKGHREGE
jgi:hypothetical protein